MSGFDTYTFLICLTVFTALTVFFAALIAKDVKNTIKMISGGLFDQELIRARIKAEAKQKNKFAHILFNKILPAIFLTVATFAFAFSLYTKINENRPVGKIPTAKVVESGSMSQKNPLNGYLSKNGLNDQFSKFDIVFIGAMPPENELKLYDVVVYECDGTLIVHRIIEIDEPDEMHSERYFLLQGDANRYPDRFPVTYSQMKGVYTGKRIKYLGSFVSFMRSPSGYLCFALIVFTFAAYPFIAKKIDASANARLQTTAGDIQTVAVNDKTPPNTTKSETRTLGASDKTVPRKTEKSPAIIIGRNRRKRLCDRQKDKRFRRL